MRAGSVCNANCETFPARWWVSRQHEQMKKYTEPAPKHACYNKKVPPEGGVSSTFQRTPLSPPALPPTRSLPCSVSLRGANLFPRPLSYPSSFCRTMHGRNGVLVVRLIYLLCVLCGLVCVSSSGFHHFAATRTLSASCADSWGNFQRAEIANGPG